MVRGDHESHRSNFDFGFMHPSIQGKKVGETVGKLNNKNFLSVIDRLAQYDSLQELLGKKSNGKYMDPWKQNKLTALLSQRVQNKSVFEIQEAEFYSIIMDPTQDLSKVGSAQSSVQVCDCSKLSTQLQLILMINEAFKISNCKENLFTARDCHFTSVEDKDMLKLAL